MLDSLFVYLNVFLDSSMAEHSAVNRRVVGSSPTRGVFLFVEGYSSIAQRQSIAAGSFFIGKKLTFLFH